MSKLIGYVTVHNDDGVSFTFAPGEDVPDWAAGRITNPAVWDSLPEVEAADKAAKPFSQLNKGELEDVVRKEGVDISAANTNDEIRAAIKAARESK
jgi:hypothetical protein